MKINQNSSGHHEVTKTCQLPYQKIALLVTVHPDSSKNFAVVEVYCRIYVQRQVVNTEFSRPKCVYDCAKFNR